MHVLTLTPFYPTASDDAIGCFIAEPLRPLEELGVKSSVIAVQPIYRGRVVPSARAPSACWVYYPAIPSGLGLSSAGSFLFASLLSRVRKLHRMKPIDLIHAHAALPCGHAAALLSRELGIPFVVTVHGLDVYMTNQVRGYPGRWCENVSRMVYRSARCVICISEKVRDCVTENPVTPLKTCVIYNGVDAQVFVPARSGCMSSALLSVGNLIPIKGHGLLLRAFAASTKATRRSSVFSSGTGRSVPDWTHWQIPLQCQIGFVFSDDEHERKSLLRWVAVCCLLCPANTRGSAACT